MSRRRYFEEQRSGNGAIYHCVEIDTDHDTYFEVLDLMSKDESDTVSPDKVNNVLNQLRQGSCFNIHTQSIVSFEVIEKRSNAIFIKFNPTPAPSEQHGIIYRFQINNRKYVFMFSNNYDGKRNLIQNADEDVDCMTKDGGYSQFMSSSYRANGGKGANKHKGGDGGSAGSSSYTQDGASDGGDTNGEAFGVIKGQGHTTRDFGESGGKRNAGGGSGETNTGVVFQGGISDYSEGSGTGGSTNGSGKGGGGYGGGGGGVRYSMVYAGAGGDGTVLIRGRRYKS